jgi:hypothetical protein
MYNAEEAKKNGKGEKWNFLKESKLYERWMRIKQRILLRREGKKKGPEAVMV